MFNTREQALSDFTKAVVEKVEEIDTLLTINNLSASPAVSLRPF